ncbi:MAG: tetratricopeptide repeat-containing protein, partial [Candidatus Korobacteraceae bacterium]
AWEGGPYLYTRLANALIQKAQYAEARDVLKEVGEKFAETLRWRQLKGSALARFGLTEEARQVFEALEAEGHRDPETLGIHARTWMDSYDKSGDVEELRHSRQLYAEAFEIMPADYYPGINAAAKSAFLREFDTAHAYNRQVRKILAVALRKALDDYWLLATVGETKLIKKNYIGAAKSYRRAVIKSPKELGDHFSTWLQAKRLMHILETPDADRDKIWRQFQHLVDMTPAASVTAPACRRLRVFAFDPSMARHLATAPINEVTLQIPWESKKEDGSSILEKGPVGEYLEVVDYDPASECFYEPVDLNDPRLLAMDGLAPSEGEPRFHQQMVYAVAMNLIDHFERALGRKVLWSSRSVGNGDKKEFLQRLRIYPHAFRGANAYYSPQKKAVLFGYFKSEVDDPYLQGTVFTCLSHDVVAHEMTHALVDGLHPRFTEASNPDVFALHEAVADLIALFQHFSHSEILRHEIARTRSDLGTENLLGQLAQQFGQATGNRGALRDALGKTDKKTGEWQPEKPTPGELDKLTEPHARGAILVGAVFDAFLAIYRSRTADLLRIATQGSGVLPLGALHPDLVNRLAHEAAKTAGQFLRICIRALDYCPPVDITFGDYLRAMITADVDYVRDDKLNYRLAILEGFQRRGIQPSDVRNFSVESVVWRPPRRHDFDLRPLFEAESEENRLTPEWRSAIARQQVWKAMQENKEKVKNWLEEYCSPPVGDELGLSLGVDSPAGLYRHNGRPKVEVHSMRLARRNTVSGTTVTDMVVEILQQRRGYFDEAKQAEIDKSAGELPESETGDFTFYGGCTLMIDPSDCRIRYSITKHILSKSRLERERRFRSGQPSLAATYFGDPQREPFAFVHSDI